MKKYPLVSIIFPNYNGGRQPLDCLASINKLNYPENKIEIIVVDNNSLDGSDIQIQKKFPHAKLIKMKRNLGFAKAVNWGIALAHGEYIFIGNNDLVFEKNSLVKMVNFMLTHKEIGIVGGKILYKHVPRKIASSGYMMNKWTGHIYSPPQPEKIHEPDWVQGCAQLTSKSLLNKLGLLDPHFTFYFEDYDLCLKAKKRGYKIVYLPTAVFWHAQSATADKNKSYKEYFWYKSKFYFLFKNFPLINVLSILLTQMLIITPYKAIILRDGTLFPTIKALWWNIKNLPLIINTKKVYK